MQIMIVSLDDDSKRSEKELVKRLKDFSRLKGFFTSRRLNGVKMGGEQK